MPAHLPPYLRKYVTDQDHAAYTPTEHATWRFIMRQSRHFFKDHAVAPYLNGLKQTGISIDRIPRISEINTCLGHFGWGAVGVEGFIPSSVFLDLLARNILPIATDMRTLEHVGYTPAPDIVHEAAGHAPIIADADYRNFLSRYSEVAYRALISAEDIALYEAIRYLSDIKENPDIAASEVASATRKLKLVYQNMKHVSEATKIARLGWWTIEYGLTLERGVPKIYGAGLLSSIAESKNCLSGAVEKRPLTADCVYQGYDITEPQPQLFVAESLAALPAILSEIEDDFSFKRGGEHALSEMLKAETVNSILFESGASASGILESYLFDGKGRLEFFKLHGPSQLCFQEKEIEGQGKTQHPHGFSSPVGRWRPLIDKRPQDWSDHDLRQAGLEVGKRCTLHFTSGFSVHGRLTASHRCEEKLVMLSWQDCSVRRGDKIYSDPSWGSFDQIVGTEAVSVFAGPADKLSYGDFDVGTATSKPGRSSEPNARELRSYKIYDRLRSLRSLQADQQIAMELEALSAEITSTEEWLAAVEILEIATQRCHLNTREVSWAKPLYEKILANTKDRVSVERGLELLAHAD